MMFQTERLAFSAEGALLDDGLERLLRIGCAQPCIGHGHLARAFFDQRSRSAFTKSGLAIIAQTASACFLIRHSSTSAAFRLCWSS
jgi:hypothetical protein